MFVTYCMLWQSLSCLIVGCTHNGFRGSYIVKVKFALNILRNAKFTVLVLLLLKVVFYTFVQLLFMLNAAHSYSMSVPF